MKQSNILYFAVNEPYELFHKKNVATSPVGAHTHNAAEIYLTLTDLPDVLLNDTVSEVRKGSMIIIPPFCVHQMYHKKDIDYERYIINIDSRWLGYVLRGSSTPGDYLDNGEPPLIIPLEEGQLKVLTDGMKSFEALKSGTGSIGELARFFGLFDIIDSIVRGMKGHETLENQVITDTQKRVNDIIAYINSEIMAGVSVEQIAEHFYLNKDYISRLFSKHTHTTIGRYVSLQRISKAQELLSGGKTVTEVQEIMGYSSYAHFFKTFKKLTGISPSCYRKQYMDQKEI